MDELSQVQDENLFNDDAINDEIVQEASERENGHEHSDDMPIENESKPVSQAFLKVRYDKEERELSEDEARDYAEKGMNYDRLRDKYNALNDPLLRLARLNNLNSVEEMLNMLNDTQFQYEVSKEVQNLQNDPKYEGVSEEILEEIANSRVSENLALQDKRFEESKKSEVDAQQAEIQRQVDTFLKEYPNVSPDSVDQKVFDYIKQGYTLLEAYNKWSRETSKPVREAQEKVRIQNEENKLKSLGNTTNAGNADADDFMSGFLKG